MFEGAVLVLHKRELPGVWCLVFSGWCLVFVVWCLVFGVRCLVFGVRCLVFGVWGWGVSGWCLVCEGAVLVIDERELPGVGCGV